MPNHSPMFYARIIHADAAWPDAFTNHYDSSIEAALRVYAQISERRSVDSIRLYWIDENHNDPSERGFATIAQGTIIELYPPTFIAPES